MKIVEYPTAEDVEPTDLMIVETSGGTKKVPVRGITGLQAYPVGSIYLSFSSTSPASLFGGSWTQLTNVVLRAANNTSTGGSDSISHLHYSTTGMDRPQALIYGAGASDINGKSPNTTSTFKGESYVTQLSNVVISPATKGTGNVRLDGTSTTTVSNLPKYQNVYAWRRIG